MSNYPYPNPTVPPMASIPNTIALPSSLSILTLQGNTILAPDGPWATLHPVEPEVCTAPRAVLAAQATVPTDEAPVFSWMPAGRLSFESLADRFASACAPSNTIPVIRPTPQSAVSDAPSTLTFLRARESRGWRLLFDPVAMLTPPMLAKAEDHLARLFDLFGNHPATAAILLAGCEPAGDSLIHRPLTPDDPFARAIVKAWKSQSNTQLPVVLIAPSGAESDQFNQAQLLA